MQVCIYKFRIHETRCIVNAACQGMIGIYMFAKLLTCKFHNVQLHTAHWMTVKLSLLMKD